MRIALIDYRAGNLTSVRKALATVGADVYTPEGAADLAGADGIIVPGVGHFEATAVLDAPWREAIRRHVDAGRPLLGICLGLQWLFEGSTEAPGLSGLGLLPGQCRRLGPEWDPGIVLSDGLVGRLQGAARRLERGARRCGRRRCSPASPPAAQAYFTHSYAAPIGDATVATTSNGPNTFASVVERDHVFGVQFHPEKSGDPGLAILRNFLARTAGHAGSARRPCRCAGVDATVSPRSASSRASTFATAASSRA